MRSTILLALLTVLACLFSETYGAPTIKNEFKTTNNEKSLDTLSKRADGLLDAFGLGLLGVETGVKSTLEGIGHPTTKGSREEVIEYSSDAGHTVGGAIGTALKMGKL